MKNNQQFYQTKASAKKAGVDIKTAQDLIKKIMGKFKDMDNRMNKDKR